jgi:hypothetical protein
MTRNTPNANLQRLPVFPKWRFPQPLILQSENAASAKNRNAIFKNYSTTFIIIIIKFG